MTDEGNERRQARVATVTALVVVAAFVAGKAARDAFLLSSFGVESLPIFIGVSSGTLAAVAATPPVLLRLVEVR